MKIKSLQFGKAMSAALFVLLLMAVGRTNALAQTEGALNGVFTINDSGDKVRFSRGNLQYQASTSTWRFATQQYDYVGTDNENISATYGGWIDLFGWGTSGYHNPYDNYNTQYQPYSTSTATVNTSCNTYGYGPSTNMQDSNLTGTSAEYDWGVHNAISNGGNQTGLWRTLTKDEWNYIFKTRTASTVGGRANARFVMSQVNGVNGLILFPDEYTHPSYLPTPLSINNASAAFNVNSFTNDGWTAMENLGCVFLPAAGCRYGNSTRIWGNNSYNQTCGTFGLYWSTINGGYLYSGSNFYYAIYAFHVGIKSGSFYYCDNDHINKFFSNSSSSSASYGRFGGYSVRLVCEVGPTVYNIGTSINPAEGGMVSGGGEYAEGTTCTLTATPNPGYSFINWTENGTVVTTNTSYIFTVTGDRNLVANFSINSYNVSATVNPTNSGSITGTGSYDYGETATLTAIANEGYTFTNWTENGTVVSNSESYSFAVTGSRTLMANFTLNSYFIAVAANPSNGGTVTGSGTYNHGTTANLTATASDNYVFSNWTENGNVVSTDANYSFTVTGTQSLVANFTSTLASYTVIASANPTGGGTVSGMGTYEEGATCTLTATANTGYTFTNWTENGYIVSTNATCNFTVTGNRSLVANFTLNNYYIATLASPTVGGTVTGAGNYNYGNIATLTATANNGYSFLNWTENGNIVSTSADYSFTVTGTRNLVANFSLNTYTVSAAANPSAGGSVSGMGTFNYGETVTLTATANEGYTFASWTENGTIVSTNANYGFEVTGDRSLVANFNPDIYTVSVSVNPTNGGSAIGGGTYAYGTTCALTAVANEEYSFINWTENGTEVSTDAAYSFIVSANRALVANFSYVGIEGQLSGSFSVNDNTQICFSQGNLQYNAFTNIWRFATNQFDYIGEDNSNISETYDGWIDLFGWGTSGWDNGNVYFHPWDSNNEDPTLYGPPGTHNHLSGEYANADWGVYNAISNGGNQVNQWRTLSHGHWLYLINSRNTSSGVRYAKAQVNNISGLILVPDNWDTSIFELQDVNTPTASFDSNVISLSVWANVFESNGAIFLPAAGGRYQGTTLYWTNVRSLYWTSSGNTNEGSASIVYVDNERISVGPGSRSTGYAVRLVRTIPNIESYSINTTSSPSEGGTVSGSGCYTQNSTCTLSAIANEGYTFVNWTKNGTVISTSPNYSFTVTESGTYAANFQLNSYQVTATANPSTGGNITGAGTYNHFETCTLTATANAGYSFVNWTKDGQEVSTNAVYNFTVTEATSLVANFQLTNYNISVTANPAEGGTITGAGTYSHGQTCTLSATANEGYTFINWTRDGEIVSMESVYSFTVVEGATFVANFEEIQVISYNISASSNPSSGGSVTGAGNYMNGQTCTLTANANEGYSFGSWTENGETISTEAIYSFTVDGDKTLVANFAAAGNYWTPENISSYSLTMALTGIIQLDGIEQYSDQLEVGVFCGDECRGSQIASEFFLTNRYLVMLSIAGEIGDVLTFKLYDHGLAQELNLTSPAPVTFNADGYGTPIEPYALNFISAFEINVTVDPEGAGTITGAGSYNGGATCTLVAEANVGFQFENWTLDGVEVSTNATYEFTVTQEASYIARFQSVQTQALSSGWNWYSTYINQAGINGLTMLENSLGSNGIRIQSKSNGYVDQFEYNGISYWYGTLNAITNEQMYMVRTNTACDATMSGQMNPFASHPITINNGWNWIGFPGNESTNVSTAMSGFTPEANDQIKSKNNGYSTYIVYGNNALWYGTLNTLEPGQGYMYKSNSGESKTLVYQNGRGETLSDNVTTEGNTFPPEEANYAYNMTITAVVELDGDELRSEDYELAAFVGNECRGSVKLMYVEPLDRYMAFLLVSGETEESLRFVLTDGRNARWSEDHLMYGNDETVGTPTAPAILHFGSLGMNENGQENVQVYPNPSKDVFNIKGGGIRKVEIINAYGQVICTKEVKDDFVQIDLGNRAVGVYLLRVVTDKGITTQQIIKNN